MLDLGEWWLLETGLPLPLGVNVARRDIGDRLSELSAVLLDSIQAGLANRREAMRYAMRFGRGIDAATADQFVGMYVNELTCDYGDEGRAPSRSCCAAATRSARFPSRSGSTTLPEPAPRAVVLSAVRTPVGRYGGGLAGVRPDDLAAIAVAAAVERAGVDAGRDRGRLPRLREPGGRGQPERRADGGAARRAAGVGRRA